MIKSIDDFVSEYKVVLNMKKVYDFKTFRFPLWRTGILVFLIVGLVFLGIGWLTGQLDSFHYVFLTVNTTVFSCLALPMLDRELRFRNQKKIGYDVFAAIGYDLFRLLAVMSSVNSVVLLLLFNKITSVVLIIGLFVISIVSLVAVLRLKPAVDSVEKEFLNHPSVSKRVNIMYLIPIYILVDIILLYELDFSIVELDYTVPVLVLTVVYLALKDLATFDRRNTGYFAVMLAIFASMFVFYIFRSVPEYFQNPTATDFNYITYEPVYDDTIDNVNINKLFLHGDSIYMEQDGVLHQYDQNMVLIDTIDPNLDNIRYFFFVGEEMKVLVKNIYGSYGFANFSGTYVKYFTGIIYDLTDPENPVEEYTGTFIDDSTTYESKIIYYGENVLNIENSDELIYFDIEGEFDVDGGDRIIYQTDDELVLFKDGSFHQYVSNKTIFSNPSSYQFYSNQKLLVVYQDNTYVVDVVDYIAGTETYDRELDLNVGTISAFLYDGERYIIDTIYGISIYDEDLNLIDSVDTIAPVYLTEDLYLAGFSEMRVISWPYLDFNAFSEERVYFVKTFYPDNLYEYAVTGAIGVISPWLSFMIAAFLVFIPFVPKRERGELNG